MDRLDRRPIEGLNSAESGLEPEGLRHKRHLITFPIITIHWPHCPQNPFLQLITQHSPGNEMYQQPQITPLSHLNHDRR